MLIYRRLDAKALVALQMRNPEALRQLAVLALQGAELIATRQMEMAQRNLDQFNGLCATSESGPDIAAALAKQASTFGRGLGTLAADTQELTELGCKCGCDMLKQLSKTLSNLPLPEPPASERGRIGSEKD